MQYQYSHTYKRGRVMSEAEIQDAGAQLAEQQAAESAPPVVQLEQFAFNLLNDLADNHGLSDDDQIFFTNWIWRANTPAEMSIVIQHLKSILLQSLNPFI